jgi:hypothetical protein
MPTSDESWSASLRVISELERPDHWYLTDQDGCYFFGAYTARAGYKHSSTNQFIHNLKKKPNTRGTSQWDWKMRAIRDAGSAIRANIIPEMLTKVVFVPIPPSKIASDPEYDDRMTQVARAIGPEVDVREVLYTKVQRTAMHAIQTRRNPDALRATLGLRSDLLGEPPAEVILLDDLLTTGCSFKVCKAMLLEVWPNANITGIFIARRVPE